MKAGLLKFSVENISWRTTTGGIIYGMEVMSPDNYCVIFAGRCGKKQAIRQAIEYRRKKEGEK